MQVEIYKIDAPTRGALYIMPKPLAEHLQEQMAHLASMGISEIVSLMEVDEARDLGLGGEEACCVKNGMAFTSYPIRDYGLPDGHSFGALADRIRADLDAGRTIAVHCKGGIGRSGMLSSLVMAPLIGSAEAAIKHVSKARGVEVPDTQAQRDFVIRQMETS